MKKLKGIILLIFISLIIILVGRYSSSQEPPPATINMDEPCSRCHTCSSPTPENPCLPVCARYGIEALLAKERTALPDLDEIIVINELQNIYEPVNFTHQAHAMMSLMGKGCTSCHHHTPPGRDHPPCKECHDSVANKEHLKIQSLKAAYHQQCLTCHVEWGGTKNCDVCHPMKGSKAAEDVKKTGKTYDFPKRKPSDTITFMTKYEGKSNKVTFNHKEHNQDFGFDCSNCHSSYTCNACHNPKTYGTKPIKTKPSYSSCSACHPMDHCGLCHPGGGSDKTFNHAKTGLPLIKYHNKLSCRKCHKGKGHYMRLNKSCTACHYKWTSDNFSHSIVGLKMDEIHATFECTDCHENRQYDKPVMCAHCHDDTYKYPSKVPGTRVKGKY